MINKAPFRPNKSGLWTTFSNRNWAKIFAKVSLPELSGVYVTEYNPALNPKSGEVADGKYHTENAVKAHIIRIRPLDGGICRGVCTTRSVGMFNICAAVNEERENFK